MSSLATTPREVDLGRPFVGPLPHGDYHGAKADLGAISYSAIKRFADNPWRFNAGLPDADSPAMRAGSLADTLILTPDELHARYEVSPYDAYRSAEAKAWRQRVLDSGKEPVKEKELHAAELKYAAMKPATLRPLIDARRQIAIFAVLPGSEQIASCQIDAVPTHPDYADSLVDIKNTRQIDPELFSEYEIAKYGYFIQAAWYLDLFNVACPFEPRSRFHHLVIEQTAPYENGLIEMSDAYLDCGRRQYRHYLAEYLKCKHMNVWPSPYDRPQVSRPPMRVEAWTPEPIAPRADAEAA